MTDSFVFYKSFYKSIRLLDSDSEKWEMIQCLCELAFNGTEADESQFSDMQKVIYYITEKQIKASVQHKLDGAKGGHKKASNRALKDSLISRGVEMGVEENNSSLVSSNANVNVNVNDNVNVNVNNSEEMPSPFTPSQENYSKKVFSIFSDAKLPCAKNNEISFLMSDFKNALSYIHSAPDLCRLSSDDIIGACENYVKVLNDSSSYVSVKMGFYSLVKSKLFYNLLPQNFIIENYRTNKDSEKKTQTSITYDDAACPNCGEHKLYWSNQYEKFICSSCNNRFIYEVIYE